MSSKWNTVSDFRLDEFRFLKCGNPQSLCDPPLLGHITCYNLQPYIFSVPTITSKMENLEILPHVKVTERTILREGRISFGTSHITQGAVQLKAVVDKHLSNSTT